MENSKGRLMSDKWLREKGYDALVEAIEKHPKSFAHIKQNKEKIEISPSLEEWVAIAERDALANINGELEEIQEDKEEVE